MSPTTVSKEKIYSFSPY